MDIIEDIYATKAKEEKFILSCGHAGLALYVVLEKYGYGDAEEMLNVCGIHPDRAHPAMNCSTGSLGQGLPIALGMALADRSKNVHVLMSDGESMEGTLWECANVIRKYNVKNLKIQLNYNGYGAYDEISLENIMYINEFFPDITIHRTAVQMLNEVPFLEGLSAHYVTATKDMIIP